MSHLVEVVGDSKNLLIRQEARLEDVYVAGQIRLRSVGEFEGERAVQAVLRPVPNVRKRYLLQHERATVVRLALPYIRTR